MFYTRHLYRDNRCIRLCLLISLVCEIFANRAAGEFKIPLPESLHATSGRPTQNDGPMQTKHGATTPGGCIDDICLTPECLHTASAVLSKMQSEVEPCDDFYRFACGTYLDEEIIPEDRQSVSTFSAIGNKLQEQLKDIITEERSETEPKYFRLPNALYKACMNKTLVDNLGATPIVTISESLGGWPLIKGREWDADGTWTWQETVKKFRRLGFSVDYIFEFAIGVDLKNNTKRLIELDQSAVFLNIQYLMRGLNEPLVTAYYDYMVDIAVLFGADIEQAKREMLESLQFEMDLANISLLNENRRNAYDLYNLRAVEQLQESYPYVQWLDYINALLPDGLQVDEDEQINVYVPSFFDDLGKLLAKTPKRTIANYMMWRIHAFAVSFLSEPFLKREFQYVKAVTGRQEQEARWKEGVDITCGSKLADVRDENRLAILVGSLYVRKHFKEDSKQNALEMVSNIRAAFNDMLESVDWMDAQTKKEATKKLHAMATHIGYPDEMLDNAKLEEYYRKLDIDPDKYFESILKMSVFGADYTFNKLRLPASKTDWMTYAKPAVVNAFYSRIENSIHFPAGILQGHFFNAHRPKYMNYGAIGFVIGHEITHGFDDQGRQFDVEGNLIDWWQPDTRKAYVEKAKCFIDQYGNYTERSTGLNINGINTQGENIADNGGVKEAYIAYGQWAAKNGPEPKLPGLEYTPEQMFWISAGQTWCSKDRKESLKDDIITGVNSPSEYRVLGPLRNMKEFARDFQCPDGSSMNPVKKCVVW